MQGSDQNSDMHERELLRQSAEGNRQAFNSLYGSLNIKVYAYIQRLLANRADAEDVFVDTFHEVWKNAGKFKGDSKVATWIIGIARNLCMNHLKKSKSKNIPEDIAYSGGPFDSVNQEDNVILMRTAMGALSLEHREILGLVLLPEFTYVQISTLLKVPINTVKTRIHYAKSALRKQLQNMGVDKDDL